jgi:hypothetical protein
MRQAVRVAFVVAAVALGIGLLLPAPVDAGCYECTYIPFNGMRCTDTTQGASGKTGCNDSQTCGTYGEVCTGGSGNHCIPACHPTG